MDWLGWGGGGIVTIYFFHFLIWVMGSISVVKKVMWNNYVSNLVNYLINSVDKTKYKF